MINHPDDLVGIALGSYKLTKLLGRGGMGAVYLAQDIQLGRWVAIKVLLPNIGGGTTFHNEYLTRFRQEAALIAHLEHPNIVPIYGYSEQDKLVYLVMPYFAEGNLSRLLKKHGPFSLFQTTFYTDQAAAALDYAHAHGVIHRDLKPDNFLLQNERHLILADFGIARIMQGTKSTQGYSLTLTGEILGTPAYMAPEMARGEQIDACADIYELGVVLFEMLTGSVPFQGNTPFRVLEQHLEAPFPSLHQINPTIPARVDTVLQRAVAKRPEDRYARAGELARDLKIACYRATPHPVSEYQAPSPSKPEKTVIASWNTTMNGSTFTPTTSPGGILPDPQPASTRRSHSWLSWIALALVLMLTLGGLLIETNLVSSHQAVQPPGLTPAQQAQGVVERFYHAINTWDYAGAYALLKGSSTQRDSTQAGYCSLAKGYMLTEHDDVTYTGVTTRPDRTFQVALTIVATELLSTGTVETTYGGYEVVDPKTWQITNSGQLERSKRVPVVPQPLMPDSAQAAQAVIQRFHSDVGLHNYPDAYSQWGNAFHNTTGYCDFIEQYSSTRSENVIIDQATPLNNGIVQVVATINATKDTNVGPTTKGYHTTYLVGQEEGIWRILQEVQNTALIMN